jgi:Na+-driven multidrug efflux pump
VVISFAQLFLQDDAVLKVVGTAMLPCVSMIFLGWNNALEGILIGAGDTSFVVSSFLPAAGTGIVMLAITLVKGGSLAHIWW